MVRGSGSSRAIRLNCTFLVDILVHVLAIEFLVEYDFIIFVVVVNVFSAGRV
jgi:hypothetical protein